MDRAWQLASWVASPEEEATVLVVYERTRLHSFGESTLNGFAFHIKHAEDSFSLSQAKE